MAMDSPQNQWTFVAGKINEVNGPFSISMAESQKNTLVPSRYTCCYMFTHIYIYIYQLFIIHLILSPKTCSLEPSIIIVSIQTAGLCLMVHMGIEPAKCTSRRLFSATKINTWAYNLITG